MFRSYLVVAAASLAGAIFVAFAGQRSHQLYVDPGVGQPSATASVVAELQATAPYSIPLIPAKAGTQIPCSGPGWKGPEPLELTCEFFHLGPGLRRDERRKIHRLLISLSAD